MNLPFQRHILFTINLYICNSNKLVQTIKDFEESNTDNCMVPCEENIFGIILCTNSIEVRGSRSTDIYLFGKTPHLKQTNPRVGHAFPSTQTVSILLIN